MHSKYTFLVTAIGSMSGETVIQSLKKFPNSTVIGCDIHPREWVYNSLLVDHFYQLPKAYESNYISSINKIIKTHSVDFVLPLTDPEVDQLALYINDILGAKVCISSPEDILIARDKYKVNQMFKNSSVEIIPTYETNEIEPKIFKDKLIAKPKKGRSSEGIFFLNSYEEFRNLKKDLSQYIFQPFINGEIVTVDYLRDNLGNNYSLPRKELLRTANGAGLTVEIFEDKALSDLTDVIGEELNVTGCINIEFIKTENTYYLMDINPRFSAGVGYSIMAGYDFVKQSILAFEDRKISTFEKIEKGIYCKKYTDIKLN